MDTLTKKKLYEGMFLIDSALAAADWDGTIANITRILEKIDAEIVSIKKWDERKLAYPIKRQSRGTYILCYFKADGVKIHEVEKSVQLSEQIVRAMILNAEKITPEDIEKETPAMKTEMDFTDQEDDEAGVAKKMTTKNIEKKTPAMKTKMDSTDQEDDEAGDTETEQEQMAYQDEDDEDDENQKDDESPEDTEQDLLDKFDSDDSESDDEEDDITRE